MCKLQQFLRGLQYISGYLNDTRLCRYLVALDPTLPEVEMPALPALPPNAEFVIPPACFEMGVVGWLLYTSRVVSVKDYK